MTCVLVNPYPWRHANGVTSYVRNLRSFLRKVGIDSACISNDAALPRAAYQRYVRDTLTARFRPDEIVVEAPEVESPTLLLPPEYPVHIRLHCPRALVDAHNGRSVDWGGFEEEMHVARNARVVSSPSYALLRALDGQLATDAVHVYKNPPPARAASIAGNAEKKCDLVFLGRFSRLKGEDFLEPLLRRLPAGLSIAMAGRGSDHFAAPPEARCIATIQDEIVGDKRLDFLGEGRASLILSRFENCSMTILESLSTNTIVVGWRVGGNEEIATPRLVRLVPLGDQDGLVATIDDVLRQPYPQPREFADATARIREDFRSGWTHAWNALRRSASVPLYRGMNCSGRPAERAEGDVLGSERLRRRYSGM